MKTECLDKWCPPWNERMKACGPACRPFGRMSQRIRGEIAFEGAKIIEAQGELPPSAVADFERRLSWLTYATAP